MKLLSLRKTLFVVLMSSLLIAQTNSNRRVPARLELEAPRSIAGGQSGKMNVKLVDGAGNPIKAESNLSFKVNTANGGKLSEQEVVIPKGQSSADVTVSSVAAGISNIQVQQANTQNGGLSATTQIGSAPNQNYVPVPPYSLALSISPGVKLKAGIEKAIIAVRMLDHNGMSIPSVNDINVAFPGMESLLSPPQISLPRGAQYAEASLASAQPVSVTLSPLVSPAMVMAPNSASVDFVSPILGIAVTSSQPYVKSVRRHSIAVNVTLKDANGDQINSDRDRSVLLSVNPPSAGILKKADLIIPQGKPNVTTEFTPLQEGVASVEISTGDRLDIQNATLEFHYAAMYFWLIAAIGGVIGGIIRNALGSDHTPKTIAFHVVGGVFTGVVAYLIAPLLVALSLKPAGLENSSKIFEAFAWGLMGGGSGVHILAKLFVKDEPPAQPPVAKTEPPVGVGHTA